jgi:hypothetical protein
MNARNEEDEQKNQTSERRPRRYNWQRSRWRAKQEQTLRAKPSQRTTESAKDEKANLFITHRFHVGNHRLFAVLTRKQPTTKKDQKKKTTEQQRQRPQKQQICHYLL